MGRGKSLNKNSLVISALKTFYPWLFPMKLYSSPHEFLCSYLWHSFSISNFLIEPSNLKALKFAFPVFNEKGIFSKYFRPDLTFSCVWENLPNLHQRIPRLEEKMQINGWDFLWWVIAFTWGMIPSFPYVSPCLCYDQTLVKEGLTRLTKEFGDNS